MSESLLRKIVEDLEWSDMTGSEGAHMGAPPLSYHASCPECHGLKEPSGGFVVSAVGHRSGCKIAAALGRPTVIEKGSTGRLTL